LLISENDSLVITDFGVSAKLNDLWQAPTGLFGFGGNIDHLSPEVMNARYQVEAFLPCEKQYSWELGIIFFEILTNGEHPFPLYGTTLPCRIEEIPLGGIPERYHELLKGLLCEAETRISIVGACEEFEHLLSQMCGLIDFDNENV
jgi:serine/threonine protein kinase